MAKTKLPESEWYQAKESASGDMDGEPWVINSKTVLSKDDRLVKKYPHLFTPLTPSRQRPEVETTTAVPGEKRG